MRGVFVLLLSFAFSGWAVAFEAEAFDYNREMLQPLTKYRQQHRRTVDGRLCAAAFVQNRKAYTGCTDAANPVGESGRSWCYVEPQVGMFLYFDLFLGADLLQLLDGRSLPWNYCGCFLKQHIVVCHYVLRSICSSWRLIFLLTLVIGSVRQKMIARAPL